VYLGRPGSGGALRAAQVACIGIEANQAHSALCCSSLLQQVCALLNRGCNGSHCRRIHVSVDNKEALDIAIEWCIDAILAFGNMGIGH